MGRRRSVCRRNQAESGLTRDPSVRARRYRTKRRGQARASGPPPLRPTPARRVWRRSEISPWRMALSTEGQGKSGLGLVDRRQDVDRAAGYQILGFFPISRHVRGGDVGRSAPPGSPRNSSTTNVSGPTWPETGRCPKRRRAPHIRCNPFRPDRRDIGAKRGQDFVAEAWLGGYDGHYTDHCRSRCCRSVPRAMPKLTSAGPLSPQGRPPEPAGGPGAAD